ncbi:MAG: CrcB family protein [Actinobacteria bacterium]|nr:CrcB family protein [Actinomycetota bacterium]
MTALLIIIGAGIGAPSRFLLDQYLRKFIKYPYGILIINALGSFVIGLTIPRINIGSASYQALQTTNTQALVAIGFAGAFTTWSTFIADIYFTLEKKRYKETFINLLASLLLGLIAASLGMHLAH